MIEIVVGNFIKLGVDAGAALPQVVAGEVVVVDRSPDGELRAVGIVPDLTVAGRPAQTRVYNAHRIIWWE